MQIKVSCQNPVVLKDARHAWGLVIARHVIQLPIPSLFPAAGILHIS